MPRRIFKATLAIMFATACAAGGYRIGAGSWPTVAMLQDLVMGGETSSAMANVPGATRRVLYWKHPSGEPAFASSPTTAADGRDFVPVHEDEEPLLAGESRPQADKPAANGGQKKILYYRNPMGLADTSPVPKKDWMGMDYIPVLEGEEDDGSTVTVSVAKIQRSGVRTERAQLRRLVRPIRSPGVAKPDERTLLTVALRADSFIEKLYVNETGRQVKKGEPLFRIYSPDMVKVQVDYRISVNATGNRDDKGALQRLYNLQLPKDVVDELRRTRVPVISFDWPSPMDGVVMEKKAIEGMMMQAGDEMMRLADLSSIWVIADVSEQDLGQIRIGSRARITFTAYPNEVFEGRVTFILNELNMATRTAKVRIEVANPDYRIKHEMFADVEIDPAGSETERVSVPRSALIDSGNRQVVIVDQGEGRFEPRQVKVGLRGDDFVEIAEGIEAGENVVVAANFLIDAESNLKAALSSFTADSPGVPATTPAETQ